MRFLPSLLLAAASLVHAHERDLQGNKPNKERVLVRFKDGTGRAAALNAASEVNAVLDRYNVAAITVPANALNGLRNNPNIEYVSINELRSWLDPELTVSSQIR